MPGHQTANRAAATRDQELRFTVHDSPDYYQLKVSVFNDDKKTDLIGEVWVDLREIIVPGGGQSDQWHSLSFRGKYAGEVRIEITYYDSRPKPEKPAAKSKRASSSGDHDVNYTATRRRPLPSDPLTGQAPPPPVPDHVQTPPRPQASPQTSYIPNQSPLQAVEYNTEPQSTRSHHHHHHQPDNYSQGPPVPPYGPPTQQPRFPERYESPLYPAEEPGYSQNYHSSQPERYDPTGSFSPSPTPYDVSPIDDRGRGPPDEDRPPPPPVHRSLVGSSSHELVHRNHFDSQQPKAAPPMRHDVLRNEAHRHSVPAYPGQAPYRRHDTAPPAPGSSPQQAPDGHQPSPPRHYSYDSAYDGHSRSMQPSVEDVPESPTPPASLRNSTMRVPTYDELDYSQAPAPLNLSGRNSAASQYAPSPLATSQRAPEANGYDPSPAPISQRDHAQANPRQSRQPSYNTNNQSLPPQRSELDGTQISHYALPALPSSLVPGVDPVLAQEISDRIYEERQHERKPRGQAKGASPRGRPPPDASDGYGPSPSPPAFTPQPYENRPLSFSSGPSPPIVKPRAISPKETAQPQHTIRRKSVSPAPAPAPTNERRLSGIPFGPDSYDALNPSVASSKESSRHSDTDFKVPSPTTELVNGKIITHDGREIDPSDHLPVESWAPEPERKTASSAAGTPDGRSHGGSPGSGAQPASASGRRQLRIAGRPHSMAAAPPPTYIMPDLSEPTTPTGSGSGSGGRNRLQKKPHHRATASAGKNNDSSNHQALVSVAHQQRGQREPQQSSPLAPIHHGDNGGSGFTPPRRLQQRSGTWDYPNENHAPQYGSSPVGGSGGHSYSNSPGGAPRNQQFSRSYNGPPAVPAKIPLPVMSGALGPPRGGGSDVGVVTGEEWSLEEEMSRIDIGTGRARRHGGSSSYY